MNSSNKDETQKQIPSGDGKSKRAWFAPGIRSKLTAFIGLLITVTVVISSAIGLQQQSKILSEGYDREAAISRKYIAAYVIEINNISQNLIRLEEFSLRIKKQERELRKYKRNRTYSRENKVSLLGVKTSLFGALGKKRVRRSRDTYYSVYLTYDDIKELEEKTRALLQNPDKPPLADHQFNFLRKLARKYIEANNEVEKVREKINEKEGDQVGKKLSRQLKRAMWRAQKHHYNLDREISLLLLSAHRKKVRELGLDTSRFRIQSFPSEGIGLGENSWPTLDTRLFEPKAIINKKLEDPRLESDLERALSEMLESQELQGGVDPLEIHLKEMDLQVIYSPHFINPSSSQRLQYLSQIHRQPNLKSLASDFLEQDDKISYSLSGLATKIATRLEELKEATPPVPPYRDSDYRKLYKEYRGLVAKRKREYRKFVKEKSELIEPEILDGVGYLRDSALEDNILIHYEPSPASSFETYMASSRTKRAYHRRWNKIRGWIYSGKSETPPRQLKRSFPNGMIGFSRSEAEQIMWKLDSAPLISFKGENEDVYGLVNKTNFAGVLRTIIDRTDGNKAIVANRNNLILSALIVTIFAIGLTFILSEEVIKKIKSMINHAEDVGQGNLNVEFESKSHDEFGNLASALNHMVGGLREREKVKGILGSMIDPVVVGEAMKDLQALKDGSEKNITAFFSDVAGFSSISEKLSSRDLASLLNEYLSAMTIILKEHDGVLDKYIGDAIVGIFNAPVDVKNHTLKAVKASLRMEEQMDKLREAWRKENKYIPEAIEMEFRIGLNSGLAKVGFMGTDALASYTMMGDAVNLAARLEAAAKSYGVNIMASENVYKEVKKTVFARKLDLIRVKGKNEPVVIYEMISDSIAKVPENIKESTGLYEEGIDHYLQRKWTKASKAFKDSQKARGSEDAAAQLMIERIDAYREEPPGDDWDGVYTRNIK